MSFCLPRHTQNSVRVPLERLRFGRRSLLHYRAHEVEGVVRDASVRRTPRTAGLTRQ